MEKQRIGLLPLFQHSIQAGNTVRSTAYIIPLA